MLTDNLRISFSLHPVCAPRDHIGSLYRWRVLCNDRSDHLEARKEGQPAMEFLSEGGLRHLVVVTLGRLSYGRY